MLIQDHVLNDVSVSLGHYATLPRQPHTISLLRHPLEADQLA